MVKDAKNYKSKNSARSISKIMSSDAVIKIVSAGAGAFLFVVLLTLGFCACLLPASTSEFAKQTVSAEISPFDEDALVRGAEATRDYTFFNHDKHDLLVTIYEMNQGLHGSNGGSAGNTNSAIASAKTKILPGTPDIDVGADAQTLSTQDLEDALLGANEKYVLTDSAIGHLDDVYDVVCVAYPALFIIFLLCIAAFAHIVFYRGAREAATLPIAAGAALLAVFAFLGAWAILDFYSMFNALHSLLFSGGSWLFSADSLLICMLPQVFWIRMGALWLAISVIGAILSILCGIWLKRSSKTKQEESR